MLSSILILFATITTLACFIAYAQWSSVTPPIFWVLRFFRQSILFAQVIACAYFPLAAQAPVKNEYPTAYYTLDAMLEREVQSSDQTGIHRYSEDLVGSIVPHVVPDPLGNAYIDALADRLAVAEQMARQGSGHLVPEANIVHAYNYLVKHIGAPSSFYADEEEMRAFRAQSIKDPILPALLTGNRNGTSCNPGEAIYLFHLLLNGSGKLAPNYLDAPRSEGDERGVSISASVGSMRDGSSGRLTIYSLQHHQADTIKLFNRVIRILGL